MNEFVNKLLDELKIDASAQEREDLASSFEERFHNIIMETALEALNESQKDEFLAAIKDEENFEDKIVEVTAQIPGLQEKIDEALQHEISLIRLTFNPANFK